MSEASAIVVGAGVFGAAVADRLAGSGWDVTLVEEHEPGHDRGTSSAHTRAIRYGHGADVRYVRMAWRARELWQELQERHGRELFVRTGVLWLAGDDDGWERSTEATLRAEGIPVEPGLRGSAPSYRALLCEDPEDARTDANRCATWAVRVDVG